MKPGLLPLMLLRWRYETVAFLKPKFPVRKTVTIIGADSAAVAKVSGEPLSIDSEVPT